MVLINGYEISNKILDSVYNQLKGKTLAVLLATNDPSAHHYVELKKEKAIEYGVNVIVEKLNKSSKTKDCINLINKWNYDDKVDGILVQIPLFKHIDKFRVLNSIKLSKDVDGLSAQMQGMVNQLSSSSVPPATVEAILEAINFTTNENLTWQNITSSSFDLTNNFFAGKNVVIMNNSNLIGLPLSGLLAKCNASVTILNKLSKNIKKITSNADIVVTATGQTQLLDHTFFKKNAIVIDVTSKKVNDKVYGDVIVNKKIENKISYITPVPGGIGPITIACLLRNLTRSLGYEQN